METMVARQLAFSLYPLDRKCLEYIMQRHGHSRQTDAIRFAVRQQASRWIDAQAECRDIAINVSSCQWAAQFPTTARMKKASGRFAEDFFIDLDNLKTIHALKTNAEAVRLALRSQAVQDGFVLPPGNGRGEF